MPVLVKDDAVYVEFEVEEGPLVLQLTPDQAKDLMEELMEELMVNTSGNACP